MTDGHGAAHRRRRTPAPAAALLERRRSRRHPGPLRRGRPTRPRGGVPAPHRHRAAGVSVPRRARHRRQGPAPALPRPLGARARLRRPTGRRPDERGVRLGRRLPRLRRGGRPRPRPDRRRVPSSCSAPSCPTCSPLRRSRPRLRPAHRSTTAVGAAFVVPEGFTAAVTPEPACPSPCSAATTPPCGRVASSLASSYIAQINAERLSVPTAMAAGRRTPRPPSWPRRPPACFRRRPWSRNRRAFAARHDQLLRAVDGHLLRALLDRLRLPRLLPRTVRGHDGADRRSAHQSGHRILGKSLSIFAYGVASLTVALVTTLGFDADWGPPLAVAA